LEPSQVADIFNWKDFFDKTYIYIGKLDGAFYNSNGEPTEAFKSAKNKLVKAQHVIYYH
jgi:hypothetical protein